MSNSITCVFSIYFLLSNFLHLIPYTSLNKTLKGIFMTKLEQFRNVENMINTIFVVDGVLNRCVDIKNMNRTFKVSVRILQFCHICTRRFIFCTISNRTKAVNEIGAICYLIHLLFPFRLHYWRTNCKKQASIICGQYLSIQ